ncbi:BnaCnng74840D, partial [Brassica napus]
IFRWQAYNMVCPNRWLPEAPTGIHSMKHLYRVTIDFYDKLEEELEMQGKSGCGSHLKKSLKSTANGYMQEAKWLRKDYTAKFDEYKENAILSSAYYTMMAMTFAGMGDFAKLDAFEWLSSQPKIRIASEIICQFTNDITSYEFFCVCASHHHLSAMAICSVVSRKTLDSLKEMSSRFLGFLRILSFTLPDLNYDYNMLEPSTASRLCRRITRSITH